VTRNISPSAAKLVPALRYRDLAAAVEWLCIAFGFEKHRVIAGEDGAVAVAQLCVGANMIMLLPVGGSELDRLMRQPDEIGGAETQSCYLAVDDIDFHYAKAKAAGAQFVLDLKAYDNGGRGFSCRDPEGHIWNFGTYDPWDGKAMAASPPPAEKQTAPHGKRSAVGVVVAMAVLTVVVGMGGWTLATLQRAPGTQALRFKAEETQLEAELAATRQRVQEALDRAAHSTAELSRERSERQAAERAAQQAREALQNRQSAKDAVDGAARKFEAQLTEERRAKEAAERAVKSAADRIEREQAAKRTAQKATLVVQKQLALARAARQAAEQTAKEAAEELARERAAREAAERAANEALAKLNRARGADKGGALNPDRSSRRLSKKSTRTDPNEPMPPLLP
jgi:uncharacterized glyoxalase superfamily protein PhnB